MLTSIFSLGELKTLGIQVFFKLPGEMQGKLRSFLGYEQYAGGCPYQVSD